MADTPVFLSSLLNDICLRAGLGYNKINIPKLDDTVGGFYTNCDHPTFTAIETLARMFFFDVSSYDGMINFIKRGGDSVATIELSDLVDDGQDVNKVTRKDNIEVPRVYNLEYYDIDGGLSSDKQSSDRSLDSRSKSEVRLETTVLMTADTAAKKVVINHKVAIEEQRGTKEFSLPISWIWLTCGDIIMFDGERMRIDEIELDDGFQNYKVTYDRQSSYTSYINAVTSAGVPSTPPTMVVGDTVLHFIDSHILRDSDDKLGYYVGISGSSTAWTGASIELSTDGGENYLSSTTSSTRSIMGELSEVLPTGSIDYPDEVNTLTVTLLRSTDVLSSVSLADMMNRANMAIVGNEIINFSNVTETSEGIWELSYLLRGRKGSAATSHSVGERFVVLDRTRLAFVDADLNNIGNDLTFRAITFGASSGLVTTETFNANCQKERTPAYLTAIRSGSDIVITWQGVGRLGGGTSIGMGQYFTGYQVTVSGAAQAITSNETMTVADPGGSVTITVQQNNSITGLGSAATVTI